MSDFSAAMLQADAFMLESQCCPSLSALDERDAPALLSDPNLSAVQLEDQIKCLSGMDCRMLLQSVQT